MGLCWQNPTAPRLCPAKCWLENLCLTLLLFLPCALGVLWTSLEMVLVASAQRLGGQTITRPCDGSPVPSPAATISPALL